MPLPRFPPPPPPPPPPQQPNQVPFFPKATPQLPDFLLTALSLVLLFAAPKHHHNHTRHFSISYPQQPSSNRRFIRPSTSMPQNLSRSSSPNPNFHLSHSFPTPQSLSEWLKPRLPSDSFATWGTKPGTKNVHNLWLELADGETSLVDTSPPIRNLEVLSIRIIGEKNRVLVEWKQELSDGSIRERGRPLSEKLKSGEEIESAVRRAIREELGSIIYELKGTKGVDFDEIVKIMPDSYEKKLEERVSLSYPGLPACYVLHTVDAVVEGLPDDDFVTEEDLEYEQCDGSAASMAVSVKKHFWKWVSADSA